jgi:hypothetical protein
MFLFPDLLFTNREAAARKFSDRDDASNARDGAAGSPGANVFRLHFGVAVSIVDADAGTVRRHETAQNRKRGSGKETFFQL